MNRFTSFLLLALVPTNAFAACPEFDTATPCYLYKYQKNSEVYEIAYHNPPECDDEIVRAAQDWTAVGSQFRLSKSAGYPTALISASPDPYFRVSFEDYWYMKNGRNRTAESDYKGVYNGYTAVNGESLWLTTDGDVRVNKEFWTYKRILCDNKATIDPYKNQVDFGKTIAEEFGHSAGLGHITVTNCAMTNPTAAGTLYNGLCPTETQALRTLFATATYPIYGR